ncbi:MAG: VWA domain-containing protein, partial [Bdellovibrionales bacterium]|nr:VWA domain-containing protein [Bdellovibrionales bacterium]
NLTAAGQTNLLPALSAARRDLAKAPASRQHIIILSDGKVPLAGTEYIDEIQRLRKAGVSVSTVALGAEADVPFMKLLAQQGKGAFYHTLDPSRLPEIFVHDIKVTTGEKSLKERERMPVQPGPSGVRSTSIKYFPYLKGLVETKAKPDAALELVATDDGKAQPVLASWDVGRGRAIAFTSDANGRWSDRWVQWDDFSQFWGDIFGSLLQRGKSKQKEFDFDLRYRLAGADLLLDLAIFDDQLESGSAPELTASVIEPGGAKSTAGFVSTAPGRFIARVKNARPGDYRLAVDYGDVRLPPLALTLEGDIFGEHPGRGISVAALSDVAFLSGGQINPAPDSVPTIQRSIEERRPLFLPLIAAAFLLVLLEAFVREWGRLLVELPLRKLRASASRSSQPSRRPPRKLAA